MFKVQKTEYVNKTFHITKELADKLSETAQAQDVSMNELVVQCCNYALANMEKDKTK